jgi:hypothetical protein
MNSIDLPTGAFDLFDDGFEAVLKFPSELGAGYHARQVER